MKNDYFLHTICETGADRTRQQETVTSFSIDHFSLIPEQSTDGGYRSHQQSYRQCDYTPPNLGLGAQRVLLFD